MSRITSHKQKVIASLGGHGGIGKLYRGEALEILKKVTGQDFGWDAAAWAQWLDAHPYKDRVWHDAIWESYRGQRLVLVHFPYHDTFNPTVVQVKDAIEHIGTGDPPILFLRSSLGSLSMCSAPGDRVTVTFSSNGGCLRKSFSSSLLDMNVDEPESVVTFQVGKSDVTRKRCETVAKAAAIEIAVRFVEHNALPTGFRWTRDVTPFT
jgi:hypothetical protein